MVMKSRKESTLEDMVCYLTYIMLHVADYMHFPYSKRKGVNNYTHIKHVLYTCTHKDSNNADGMAISSTNEISGQQKTRHIISINLGAWKLMYMWPHAYN